MPDNVSAGSEFTVTAVMKNAKGFNGGTFMLEWDSAMLEYVDAASSIDNSLKISTGKLGSSAAFVMVVMESPYASDTMTIARFTFKAAEDIDTETQIRLSCSDKDITGVAEPAPAVRVIAIGD